MLCLAVFLLPMLALELVFSLSARLYLVRKSMKRTLNAAACAGVSPKTSGVAVIFSSKLAAHESS